MIYVIEELIGFNDYMMGDINLDGALDVLDIILMVNIIVGTLEPTDTQISLSDLNNDGLINILDVVQIVNMILS